MDQQGLLAAINTLAPLCQKPEQIEFLKFLTTQPTENVEAVLQSYASKLNPTLIPSLVETEFPHFSPEMRAQLANQAIEAYNFLTPK